MAIFIIGYDLHPKRGETYGELINAIKGVSSDWWHCLDSTWLIKSSLGVAQVRDRLLPHVNNDDQLLVIEYTKGTDSAAWFGFSDECANWLRNNL